MAAPLPPQDTDAGNGAKPTRSIERRVGLPSGRAVVGALLMTVAALGVFLAYTGANEDTRTAFVVAGRDLPAGTTMTSDDLTTARLDLDESVADRAFTDESLLVGQRIISPVGEGELLQRSAVSETPDDGPRNEFTFRLAASQAVNGDLQAGDLVDVYVSLDSTTKSVARDVVLLARPVEAGRGDLVLRVAIADQESVLAVIDAVSRGDVTVVRSTHADNPDDLISTTDTGGRTPGDDGTATTTPDGDGG
ncbi:MAG TPA: SAF domain-containing protein [Acidimicrobiales bacterium]|nr:SAF domain-containing protein [Acidimicrobiales bacterium]